jgi:hypothetical protein
MITLLEARDCVLDGTGTDEIASGILSAIPLPERASALLWISDNMQFHRMYRGETRSDYQTLESMLLHMLACMPEIHDGRTKKSKIFRVLQELRQLVLHGGKT